MPPLTADDSGTPSPAGAHGDAAPASPAETTASLESRLVACGRGDRTAFAALYDDVAPRIHGLVLRIVQDLRQTDALTHEIFLEIWRASTRFDPRRGPALSWLMTLAHRRAVATVRSAEAGAPDAVGRARHARHARHATLSPPAATTPFSFHTQTVAEALAMLTPSQRLAVELAYFGGHPTHEVSEVLQLPLETAHASICDGMRNLRDAIRPHDALLA